MMRASILSRQAITVGASLGRCTAGCASVRLSAQRKPHRWGTAVWREFEAAVRDQRLDIGGGHGTR